MPLRRIAFAVAALACAWGAEAQLSKPESVVYDASKGRYLVSNVDGRNIVSCTEATTCGSGTVFASGLTGPKGLAIVGDTLYTADQPAVKGFSLATGAKVLDVTIVGSSFLNDVASDAAGNLYISDIDTGKIHAIAPGATTATTLASGLSRPNGLLYDQAGNRLITASYQTNGDISGVDLGTGAVTRILSLIHI